MSINRQDLEYLSGAIKWNAERIGRKKVIRVSALKNILAERAVEKNAGLTKKEAIEILK